MKNRHAADVLSGEGARRGGGRWNHVGIPVVYASETLSLSALELFVHFTRKDITIARSLLAIPVEIPDSVTLTEILLEALDTGWDSSPPPDFTRDLGTDWVRKGSSAILRVPSAIVPTEHDLVINPRHPEFSKVTVGNPHPFSLDDRVWK